MLEGLSEVDWGALDSGCCAPADMEGLIRGCASGNPAAQEDAFVAFFSSVWCQGTRNEVASYTVPFLLELLAEPTVLNKHRILSYLTSLVTGFFSLTIQPTYAVGGVLYHRGSPVERVLSPADEAYVVVLSRISDEVARGEALFLRFLASDIEEERAHAAWLFGSLPALVERSGPALVARLAVERSASVRGTIVFALGELGVMEPVRSALADESPIVRCIAACELACSQPEVPEPGLGRRLVDYLMVEIPGYEGVKGGGERAMDAAAQALSCLPVDEKRTIVDELLSVLPRPPDRGRSSLVFTLLDAVFEPMPLPLMVLDERQWKVLHAILMEPWCWFVRHQKAMMRRYGLPDSREEMASFLGVEMHALPNPSTIDY